MSEFDDDMLDDSIDDDLAITDEDDDGDDWKDTNSWTEEGSAEDKVKLKILCGSMTDISEQQKNVIRLFISSTFTGMYGCFRMFHLTYIVDVIFSGNWMVLWRKY